MQTKQEKYLSTVSKKIHSAEGKMAEKITALSGSMPFIYFHVVWFGSWIAINHGFAVPYISPFDPFPYGLLTMIVSLEAIFLSTFIMVAQNRQALRDQVRDIEEDIEEQEAEREVEDIQKDLDDIKRAMLTIHKKLRIDRKKRSKATL